MYKDNNIGVVIPTYRSKTTIEQVVRDLPDWIDHIVVVDDACPDGSASQLKAAPRDQRVTIIEHEKNLGVGGATVTGYRKILDLGCDIAVKIDSDGQMDTELLPVFLDPIVVGDVDYCKGNRFSRPESLAGMPLTRVIGNAGLSFFSKMSSGYWDLMDPTNGYTAIHSNVLRVIPLDKLAENFFFESDLLFRLATVKANVLDVPIDSRYQSETSNLSAVDSLFRFFVLHINRTGKRIFYNYFLRNFSMASLLLVMGAVFLLYGSVSGGLTYAHNQALGQQTPTGTILIITINILVGVQMLLAFISHDMSNRPQKAIHRKYAIGVSQ